MEKVLAAAKENENDQMAGIQTGRDRRNEPKDGPCFVYVPVVGNRAQHHELDVGKTQGSSRGWTKKELQPVLEKVPQMKVYPHFNYAAFAARIKAEKR